MLDTFDKKRVFLHFLFIFGVAAISYRNALRGSFVYDDIFLIVQNPLTQSWANLTNIFTSGYWDSAGTASGLYRPLTISSFLVERSMVGLNPFLYHLDNVILHFFCSLFVYHIVKQIFHDGQAPLMSALLFAAHPVHTEAVAWISGRAELLSSFFVFSSLWLAIRKPESFPYALLSSIAFLLGLFSKETAIVAPALIAAYFLIFVTKTPNKASLMKLAGRLYPYAISFALYMAVRIYVLGGAIGPTGKDSMLAGETSGNVFLIMCKSLTHYVRLILLPFGLMPSYMFPAPGSFIEFSVLFPLFLFAILAVFIIRHSIFRREYTFALLWFLIALLPVSNIIPTGLIMSERALYLPSFAFCTILALLFSDVCPFFLRFTPWIRRYTIAAFISVISLYSIVAANRNLAWSSQEEFEASQLKIFQHRVELYPNIATFYVLLAGKYVHNGDIGAVPEGALNKALSIEPNDPEAHFVFSALYFKRGMFQESLDEVRHALSTKPTPKYYNFASMLLGKLGRFDEAEDMADKSLELDHKFAETYSEKGNLRLQVGDDESAMVLFQSAIDLNPLISDAYLGQGIILDSRKEFSASIAKLKKAVELEPDNPEIHFFLANAYIDSGMPREADAELMEVLKYNPDHKQSKELLQRLRQPR